MSLARQASPPPRIADHTYLGLLGQGGFADVFLYQQLRPRRTVAVKVLLPDLIGADAVERLSAEADAMAGLSSHPNIVTVYGSGVAEDGRPYLTMEYCPNPALAEGLRTTTRSVADALEIGVQIAGAVETAHRAGILHRDIKPANILVTQYGKPALTDFGIAVSIAVGAEGAEGLSIPWSPPEALVELPRSEPQSDVWGLAATIYTLLAQRAPFEIEGGDNRDHAHMDRIRHAPLTRIDRNDIPGSLHQVLATAMSKDLRARFRTAHALSIALNEIQLELGLTPTRPVVSTGPSAENLLSNGDDAAGGTRLRPPPVVDPTGGVSQSGPGVGAGSRWSAAGTGGTGTGPARPAHGIGPGGASWPSHPSAPGRSTAPGPSTVPPLASSTPTPLVSWSTPPQSVSHTDDSAPGNTQLRAPGAPLPGRAPAGSSPTGGQPPRRAGEGAAATAAVGRRPASRARVVGIAIVTLVAVVGVVIVLVSLGTGETPRDPRNVDTGGPTAIPQDPVAATVPAPTELRGEVFGEAAQFTWTNPEPEEGDTYVWRYIDRFGERGEATVVREPEAEVPLVEGNKETCIEVLVVRRSGAGSTQPAHQCVEAVVP
ncbi:MAG: protein kinase [Bifidobacteriaceae bacterium]|nr:protein kinase [Bifidobacteriaceae bacterium]